VTTTAPALESYVGGRWQPGTDAGTTVVAVVTGQSHQVEAVGPVSTVMPYDGAGDVVALSVLDATGGLR